MIVHIDYKEIYTIWKIHLWPDRLSKIEPTSAMIYNGGYDLLNLQQTPIFLGYIVDNDIAGVNSGHYCIDQTYRSRGLFVFDRYRQKGIGTKLLLATIEEARKTQAKMIWSYPRLQSWKTYSKAGFTLSTDWEQGENHMNAYCKLDL